MNRITVFANRAEKRIPNFWNHLHFHPTDAVEDFWGRTVLDRIADDGAARTIRLYTMLEDLVSRTSDGTLAFDWTPLDHRLDYMTRKGFQLLLCFNFMPPCMAEHPDSTSWLRYKNKRFNSSAPSDYQEWSGVCETLTRHLLERYGRERVEKWFFQCWNEPDQIYWLGGNSYTKHADDIDALRAEKYNLLYDAFESGVHRADPEIPTGGPSVAISDRFFQTFLEHCRRDKVRLDFVSVHAYSEFIYSGLRNPWEISPENILQRLNFLHGVMEKCGMENTPMLMDEWGGATMGFRGISEDPRMIFRETEYFSAFFAKLIDLLSRAEHLHLKKMMLCLSGQDYSKKDFDGCRTLFTLTGFPKPIYNAYVLASKLGERRLAFSGAPENGHGGIIPTAQENGGAAILLYHFTDNPEEPPCDWKINLTVSGLGNCRVRRTPLDRTHGNSFAKWTELRCPEQPTVRERSLIFEAGEIKPMFETEENTSGTDWQEDIVLGNNALLLLEFIPNQPLKQKE